MDCTSTVQQFFMKLQNKTMYLDYVEIVSIGIEQWTDSLLLKSLKTKSAIDALNKSKIVSDHTFYTHVVRDTKDIII